MSELNPYQYVVLRCVPRVDREEFINVGVVVYCPEAEFLGVGFHVDADRLVALAPGVDLMAVSEALRAIDLLCRGEAHTGAGPAVRATAYGTREAKEDQGTRFGIVKAPRSTVVQPGPVHGGMTDDPERTLQHLLSALVS